MCDSMTCQHDDEINDSLDDFLAGADRERLPASEPFPVAKLDILSDPMFYEPCKKCGGTGRFQRGYSFVGQCFACKGKGKLAFKTAPEVRAQARQSKADKLKATRDAFITENAHMFGCLIAMAVEGHRFAASMVEAVNQYGFLTERQLEAAKRTVADAEARKAERAAFAQKAVTEAKAIDVSKIVAAFAVAMGNDVKRPKLRLDTFKFSRAPDTGKNAGSIYVTRIEGDEYLGRVTPEGQFIKNRSCTEEEEQRILAAASDPAAAAVAYGKREGRCSICALPLTNHESIDLGIGPICASKWGF